MSWWLRPRWITGHLLVIVTIAAFVSFGFWQLRRHDEKSDFKDAVEAAASLPIVTFEEASGDDSLYRRVVATGEYDTGIEVLVLRSREGLSGYHVLTPLRLVGGGVLLVDRGWVPPEFDEPPVAPARPIEGVLEVTGYLWPSEEGDVPDSLPTVVSRIDTAAIGAFTPYRLLSPYLLLQAQDPGVPGDLPVPVDPPEAVLGPHLGYAGQWFLFTAVVVIGYPILLWRTGRSQPAGVSDSSRSNTTEARES
jgi:surfeit locus 1 family protein